MDRHGPLPTGKAVGTTGASLKARFVIHTVDPAWRGGTHGEAELLSGGYRQSLKLAAEYNLQSITFPPIGTGSYTYPLEKAASVALSIE